MCTESNDEMKWTILGIGYVNKEHLPAIFLVTNDRHIHTNKDLID